MTVEEIARQAWEEAGDPTDKDPFDGGSFDPTTTAGAQFLRYINSAIVRIGNWKFRDGSILRLRGSLAKKLFRTGTPFEDTVLSATASTFTIAGFTANVAGQFDSWIVEVTAGTGVGQTRLIVGSTGADAEDCVCTVSEDWDEVVDPITEAVSYLDTTSELTLYKSFVQFVTGDEEYKAYHLALDPVLSLGDILKVRDLVSGQDLTPVLREDIFTGSLLQSGIPTQYKVYGNALYFDVALDESRSYEILYLKQPDKVAVGTDVPGIPEQYHEAIALWVTHNLHRVYQDYEKAYAVKRELEDLMVMSRAQGASDMDMEQGGLTVWG